MNLKQTIKVLEEHNRWRRDNNVPAKTKMVDPKILGMALDRAIEELNKLLIPNVISRLADRVDEIANKTDADINRTLFRIVGNHIEVYEIDLSEEKVKSFLGSFKINDL